jgi:hypothetical protein
MYLMQIPPLYPREEMLKALTFLDIFAKSTLGNYGPGLSF